MKRKGTYVLIIDLGSDMTIDVGALGQLFFSKGTYCYVGSALGGLDQRLRRHLSKEKILKWHADYLTVRADGIRAFISYPDYIDECKLADVCMESGMGPSYKGFGCSDCGCQTHLFKVGEGDLERFLSLTGMEPFITSSVQE